MVRFLTFPLKLQQIDPSVHMYLYLPMEDDLKIACFALETYIWLFLFELDIYIHKWLYLVY